MRCSKISLPIGMCLILLLPACSVIPVEPSGRYSKAVMDRLYDLKSWSFEGRLALASQNDSWSANIAWDHSPEAEKIKLSGPLGQGATVILLKGNMVTIDRGGDDVQSSTHPEAFINQQLGMFVPVRSLRYWVVGLPEPSLTYKNTDNGFNQAGWLSEYKQMQPVNDSVLPLKMMVMNKQVKLKLIIDHWILNGEKSN